MFGEKQMWWIPWHAAQTPGSHLRTEEDSISPTSSSCSPLHSGVGVAKSANGWQVLPSLGRKEPPFPGNSAQRLVRNQDAKACLFVFSWQLWASRNLCFMWCLHWLCCSALDGSIHPQQGFQMHPLYTDLHLRVYFQKAQLKTTIIYMRTHMIAGWQQRDFLSSKLKFTSKVRTQLGWQRQWCPQSCLSVPAALATDCSLVEVCLGEQEHYGTTTNQENDV